MFKNTKKKVLIEINVYIKKYLYLYIRDKSVQVKKTKQEQNSFKKSQVTNNFNSQENVNREIIFMILNTSIFIPIRILLCQNRFIRS